MNKIRNTVLVLALMISNAYSLCMETSPTNSISRSSSSSPSDLMRRYRALTPSPGAFEQQRKDRAAQQPTVIQHTLWGTFRPINPGHSYNKANRDTPSPEYNLSGVPPVQAISTSHAPDIELLMDQLNKHTISNLSDTLSGSYKQNGVAIGYECLVSKAMPLTLRTFQITFLTLDITCYWTHNRQSQTKRYQLHCIPQNKGYDDATNREVINKQLIYRT